MGKNLMFWNTQRLSRGSQKARSLGIAGVVNRQNADLAIFCELTQQAKLPRPVNYTYRRRNARQLCYGFKKRGRGRVVTKPYTPVAADWYKQAGYKGGNDFTHLTSRAPGVTMVGETTVYFFHAPASNNAVKCTAFLTCALNEQHRDKPWVLIGDLNVEPDKLRRDLQAAGLDGLVIEPDRATHRSGKKFDYVVSNVPGLAVTVVDGGGFSDHDPITITLPD